MPDSGVVARINQKRGMVGIMTSDGSYTIMEIMGVITLSVGDNVEWDTGSSFGSSTLRNLTAGDDVDVFVQNHFVSRAQLSQQLLENP